MNCQTAQLMLEFARPQHVELEPADLRALEAHVAACPACTQASKQECLFDEQLGQAMRAIDVPDRLRTRLLDRLAQDRAANSSWRHKRLFSGALAAAAAVLLAVGGWLWYRQAALKPLDFGAIVQKVNEDTISPPDRARLEEAYRKQGIETAPPAAVNYLYLVHYGLGELQGRQVPCLVFIRNDEASNFHAEATVYVVSDQQFNLKDLPAHDVSGDGGYRYKVEVDREPGAPYAYVYVHTGDNLDWLRRPE